MKKTPVIHHHSMIYLSLCVAAFFIITTDAKINGMKRFDVYSGGYDVSSPFNLPPYDSLPPVPNTPFCVNPPLSGGGPTVIPPPVSGSSGGPIENPPSSPFIILSPPYYQTNPPIIIPGPPQYEPIMSPPYYYEPSPPSYVPISPPISGPPGSAFLPPVVYPPPVMPPPPHIAPAMALWCVAKPSVPDPIIQEAMNYACTSGAECDQIQPSGSCFQPDTLFAHASYAFNSYWQRTKVAGGTCQFGGTAMLVTVDPSYDGCYFVYNG